MYTKEEMDLLKRVLKKLGLNNYDIAKYSKGNALLFTKEEYLDSMDECCVWIDDDEREEFIRKFDLTNVDTYNFYADCDMVIIDGQKYMIEYFL